ncbi:MAG TPA: hypothetical protein VHA11_14955 [Bryobacteraceae bacterium]|nr:hypothetical protein [Bryobacteraceae bacterium]
MKRIALVGTVYTYLSHVQHIADRFLVGYPRGGEWHRPDMKIVSAYIDQRSVKDLSGARALEFGFTLYPTIAEALRCGGAKLAVDAVLIVAEHGDYPRNQLGQVLYPRHKFFMECVDVFEKDGRAVPVYNDKHLSYSFEKARSMVAASRRLRFPVLAGSSLPVTWRLPDLELPLGCEISEALMVGVGGSDAMDFHALEAMQCMIERRGGGETGVRSVELLDGAEVWKAGEQGRWSKTLLGAALSRSDTPLGNAVRDARTEDLVTSGALPELVPRPAAYLIEHNDGLKTTLLMLDGAVKDFNFAARVAGLGVRSCQFLLTPVPNVTYSACLVANIEEMFASGRAPYPVERTLLVSGVLERCLTSRAQGNRRLATPHLKVAYRAPRESGRARA